MSPELIGILGVGIGLLTAIVGWGALIVTLLVHFDKRTNQRIDRLEDRIDYLGGRIDHLGGRIDRLEAEMNRRFELMQTEMNRRFELMQEEMNRRFELMQAEMNRRFDEQDVRIRHLEQGQAHLAGQFSELKDYFTHQPGTE